MKKIISLVAFFAILWPQLSTFNPEFSIFNSEFSILNAQTIKVVSKQGKVTNFDVSKTDSVTFQSATPGFTIYGNQTKAQYTFDKVEKINTDAKYLFSHPDTVYVNGNTGKFAFQLNANVDYTIEPSAAWIRYDGKVTGTDSLRFIFTNNPLMTNREGKVFFVSKTNDAMRDTLVVVQTGKNDTHYIDIDWATTTVNSFNEATGQCVLTFQGEVPEMGQYDAFLLPTTDSYCIRLVDNATQTPGSKTVTLATREGKMGNLFRNKSFTLCSDPNYDPNAANARALMQKAGIADDSNIIYPEVIELCADGKPIGEVYNRRAPRRATELNKAFNIYELNYDKSGDVIWESGSHSISWEKCTFDVGLKGVFYFNFGDIPWEQVRFGDLNMFQSYLEGDFNTELILKYALSKRAEFTYEKTLKEDIFSYRVKFMVGTIPVWINISSDLKASVEASAEGTVSVTSGVTASANVKAGLQWDRVNGATPIKSFTYDYSLVEPEVNAEAHAEAKAYVWPEIKIGIYDVLCPTINPKPYIRAYADARTAESNKPYFGWNAGVSTGVDLTLGLSLDLFFFEKDLGEIEPINLVDFDLVELPYRFELMNKANRNILPGDTCHIIYQVKGKNRITNSEYLMPGALVKVEKTGGGTLTSDQMADQEGEFYYTNKNGEIVLVYTQSDDTPANIKATLVTGDEERDKEAVEWKATIKDYRLKALEVDETTNTVTASSSGKVNVKYLLEEYSKSSTETSDEGRWVGMNNVNLTFKTTGGSVEEQTVKTADGGYATAKFDGGNGYAGNGTLEASAYIAEFDTTLTVPVIKIDKFKFDDTDLNKCYNLADNTALCYGKVFKGETFNVKWSTHVYDEYMKQADMSFSLEKPYSHTESSHVADSRTFLAPYNGTSMYVVSDNKAYAIQCESERDGEYTKHWTRHEVECTFSSVEDFPIDRQGSNSALCIVLEGTTGYAEWHGVDKRTYFYIDDNYQSHVLGKETLTSDGPWDIDDMVRWDSGNNYPGGSAVLFEENGKFIYLYYAMIDNLKLYVKAVFDREGNTVNQ